MSKHRPDMPAMVFGLIFMMISGWWFASRSVGFGTSGLGVVTAGILILLGIAGIATALRNNARP
jgi:hypothetical protein